MNPSSNTHARVGETLLGIGEYFFLPEYIEICYIKQSELVSDYTYLFGVKNLDTNMEICFNIKVKDGLLTINGEIPITYGKRSYTHVANFCEFLFNNGFTALKTVIHIGYKSLKFEHLSLFYLFNPSERQIFELIRAVCLEVFLIAEYFEAYLAGESIDFDYLNNSRYELYYQNEI